MSNLHTEAEAREKWCPHTRVNCFDPAIPGSEVACNRNGANYPIAGSFCIASNCMAWQWERTHINNPDCPGGDLIPSTKTYGRCGLTSQGGKHG